MKVKVIPNSKKVEVKKDNNILIVKLDVPPKDGKANKRLIEILSKYYSVSKSKIRIIKGLKSKNKIIEII